MRKTKRPVLLPIVAKVRASLDTCRKRTVMSEYVLLTPEGRPYSESTIKRYFNTAKAIAGITRRFRFHDQRHTFASTLASKGINSFCAARPAWPHEHENDGAVREAEHRNLRRRRASTRLKECARCSLLVAQILRGNFFSGEEVGKTVLASLLS